MKQRIKNTIIRILECFQKKEIITKNIVTLAPNELLKDKVAMVTGGAGGIGRAIAEAFMKSGATVIITGRNMEKLNACCSELSSSLNLQNRIFPLELDNNQPDTFNDKLDEAIKISGADKINILVNNAGILGGNIRDVKPEEFDKIMSTNLRGTFFLCQTFGKYFKHNKIEGNILNISSSSGLRPADSAYSLSKWGIRAMTLGLAKSFIPYGIVVNGLAPGPTATTMLTKDVSNLSNKLAPNGRYATPEEIANMAVFLVSDMGKTIVGDTVFMTGGSALITYDDYNYSF